MKKKINKPMRAAGILLVATMLSTCLTAGTFAKYTTTDSATDTARVAKFGVTVTANGSLFGQEYSATAGNTPIVWSTVATNTGTVQVNATDKTGGTKVVAPGTKSDSGMGISIKGTPEVDVCVTGTLTTQNIGLKAGTYGVMVEQPNVTAENFASEKARYTPVSSTDPTQNPYGAQTGLYKKATAAGVSTYTLVGVAEAYHDSGYTGSYYKLYNSVTLASNYFPVQYWLTGSSTDATIGSKNKAAMTTNAKLQGDTLPEVAYALIGNITSVADSETTDPGDGWNKAAYDFSAAANGTVVQANNNIATVLGINDEVINWEWQFERTGMAAADLANVNNADTILGDLMAQVAGDATFTGEVVELDSTDYKSINANNYSLTTSINLTLNATQVD